MTATARLAIAGFAATGVGFGPARMGYGLFLPQFRAEFGFSTSTAGLVASVGFVAFLAALPLTAFLVARFGPRLPVVLSGLSALAGFLLVAMAPGLATLAAGVVVAGTSAGLCWAPFNDAVERTVDESERGAVLSVIATGTAIGVALAGVLALIVTRGFLPWPAAWWIFATMAAAAAIVAVIGVPRVERRTAPDRPSFAGLLHREAIPLHMIALVFGATNAVFISFAADRIAEAGGLPGLSRNGAAAVVFTSYGVFGLLGLATGRAESQIGLDPLIRVIFAAAAISMLLIGVAPTGWIPVVAASGIHGAALMAVSAVISFWSLRLFPGRGTLGFTTALIGLAVGSVIGPVVAGFAIEAIGAFAMFLAASVPALAIALWPRRVPATLDGRPCKG